MCDVFENLLTIFYFPKLLKFNVEKYFFFFSLIFFFYFFCIFKNILEKIYFFFKFCLFWDFFFKTQYLFFFNLAFLMDFALNVSTFSYPFSFWVLKCCKWYLFSLLGSWTSKYKRKYKGWCLTFSSRKHGDFDLMTDSIDWLIILREKIFYCCQFSLIDWHSWLMTENLIDRMEY